MKIELRKISVNHRVSEETLCFAADIWIDGKRVGYARNHGQGGETDVHVQGVDLEAAREAAKAWITENGTDQDRDLITPMTRDDGSVYGPDPLTYLVDHLADLHVKKQDDARHAKRLAKTEAKNAASFAADGFPWMVRCETPACTTWIAMRDNAPATLEKALAKVREKYKSITAHAVLSTRP